MLGFSYDSLARMPSFPHKRDSDDYDSQGKIFTQNIYKFI